MSQVGYGPPVRLDGPLPQRRPGCLLDVATVVPETDEHWLNGARIYPFPPDAGFVHDPCSSGSPRTKRNGTQPALPHFGAFTAYVPIKCTAATVGPDTQWFQDRAVLVMNAVESTIAERVLAKGENLDLTQPHLTDSNLVLLNASTPTALTLALVLLEDAIGVTGRGGVIHASPGLVAAWDMGGAFAPDSKGNGIAFTMNGTPVVSGAGYIGVYPDGGSAPAAANSWAFATGPVQARHTEVFINPEQVQQALDHGVNDFEYFAERHILVTWDAVLQAGVLVDRSLFR